MKHGQLRARLDTLAQRESWARENGLDDIACRLSAIRAEYQQELQHLTRLEADGWEPSFLGLPEERP